MSLQGFRKKQFRCKDKKRKKQQYEIKNTKKNTSWKNEAYVYQKKSFYQSPIILTELLQHSLINVFYLTACYLYQVMMTLHFLNDVANDFESTQK